MLFSDLLISKLIIFYNKGVQFLLSFFFIKFDASMSMSYNTINMMQT